MNQQIKDYIETKVRDGCISPRSIQMLIKDELNKSISYSSVRYWTNKFIDKSSVGERTCWACGNTIFEFMKEEEGGGLKTTTIKCVRCNREDIIHQYLFKES